VLLRVVIRESALLRAQPPGPGDNGRVDESRHVGAWVGAGLLAALGLLLLLLPVAYVVSDLPDGGDWQANHAHHVAAEHAALLTLGCVAGGALFGLLLRRLSAEPATAAGRALAVTSGALLGILLLDGIGIFWAVHDGSLFSRIGGGAF
jgi:hypothetical protein